MASQQQAEEIARLNERVRELEGKLERAQDARDDAEEDRRDAVADYNHSHRDKAYYRAELNVERRLLIRLEEVAENVLEEASKAAEILPVLHNALVQLGRQMRASKYRD